MQVIVRVPQANAVATIAALTSLGFVHDVAYGFVPEENLGTVLIRGELPEIRYSEAAALDGITIYPEIDLEPFGPDGPVGLS